MGCGESKIKEINLSPDDRDTIRTVSETVSNGRLSAKSSPDFSNEDEMLPNRLLSAIPMSDLGDSLDSRYFGESLNFSHASKGGLLASGMGSAESGDSADSGFDGEYEEENSHIITEHSDKDVVAKVEAEFRPVELPELLVITGRACARILSGYQKNKMEEAKILDSLRDEGLLAKPKGKTAGGMSFEVVDSHLVNHDVIDTDTNPDAFVSSSFIPKKKLERLETRRINIRKPSAHLESRLAEAESRRKAVEEERVKNVLERSGLERHGRMRSASALRRDNKYSATVANRQQQLQQMRDKLKEKHKKNDYIRLKKELKNDTPLMESGNFKSSDHFFDD